MSVKRVRRVRWGRVAAAIIGGALAVTLLTGFYDGDQKLVQTVYTVREGDTLREISERFLPLNTGGRRYILEFEEGIVQLNPELWENRGDIRPGQQIKINYWVKE
ncbi:LysM peptidoglycan-binding domain-containing protein [Veillonellaceae bacterium WCA-693-APC-5D-A]|uniref:LysM peptidoglycan-binding domain-containing protein n=1 Tax=Anaerovibrio slackiae TaxID=2652309 RepID=A0A6I2UGP3_9FIRM|nr:LysM domain-containing protein [Anaerovibrio slackiae]MSU08869.1 LysM peptidoglycan-binding domain-containing protein [Anaerovibrio slackiae]